MTSIPLIAVVSCCLQCASPTNLWSMLTDAQPELANIQIFPVFNYSHPLAARVTLAVTSMKAVAKFAADATTILTFCRPNFASEKA